MRVSLSCLLLIFTSPFVSGLILSMTKPNGDPDMPSIISHVTLMEQTITTLQTQVQATTTDLTTVKSALQTTTEKLIKSEDKLKATEDKLQLTITELATVKTKQQATEDELTKVKADLKVAETDVAILKHDQLNSPDNRELANMKTELEALKVGHNALKQQINSSVIDSAIVGIKSNMKSIEYMSTEQLTYRTHLQQIVNDLQTTREEVGNLTSDVVNMNTVLNHTLLDVLSRQNSTEYDLAVTKLKQHSAEMNAQVQDILLRERIGDLHRQVFALLRNDSEHNVRVAFQATLTRSASGYGLMRFDKIDYNTGGGYNKTTGMFTAPEKGMYIFWVKVALDGLPGGPSILKGEDVVAEGYSWKTDSNNEYIFTAMGATYVDKGEQVCFDLSSGAKHTLPYDSSYGGALVSY